MSRRWGFFPAPAGGGPVADSWDVPDSASDASEVTTNNTVVINSTTVNNSSTTQIAFRFLPTIPPGATIDEAKIQFTATASQSSAITVNIRGHDVDNAPVFTTTNSDITGRTVTTASVAWAIPTWAANDRTSAQLSPDIKTVVQEIVDRGGWVSGNGMAFIFQYSSGAGQRTVAAWDHATLAAPTLTVTYTP
jgi:hypothetical protein